jgi:hypothetical protein
MFSILVIILQTKHTNCTANTEPRVRVHRIQTLIFYSCLLLTYLSLLCVHKSSVEYSHKVEKEKVSRRLVTKPDMHAIIICATQIVFVTSNVLCILNKSMHNLLVDQI